MTGTGNIVHRETIAKDGFDYEATVEKVPGGLLASWFCTACADTGVRRQLYALLPDALANLMDSIDAHHKAHHASASLSQ